MRRSWLVAAAVLAVGCTAPVGGGSPSGAVPPSSPVLSAPSPTAIATPSTAGYELVCNGVPRADCERIAREVEAQVGGLAHGGIATIALKGTGGGWHVTFRDGSIADTDGGPS